MGTKASRKRWVEYENRAFAYVRLNSLKIAYVRLFLEKKYFFPALW